MWLAQGRAPRPARGPQQTLFSLRNAVAASAGTDVMRVRPLARVGAPDGESTDTRLLAESLLAGLSDIRGVLDKGLDRLDKTTAEQEREKRSTKGTYASLGTEDEHFLHTLRAFDTFAVKLCPTETGKAFFNSMHRKPPSRLRVVSRYSPRLTFLDLDCPAFVHDLRLDDSISSLVDVLCYM